MGRRVWDAKMMEVEDLPTLSDMLRAADAELLADEVLRCCAPKAPSKRARAKARGKLIKTIHEMSAMEPQASDSADEMVLLPMLNCKYEGGRSGGKFMLGVEAELVSVGELWRAGAELSGRMSEEGDGSRERLTTYSYVLEPWDKVLGYRVWMGGFSDVHEPGDARANECVHAETPGEKVLLSRLVRSSCRLPLGRRERYQFLASAVWEMTFFGGSAKKQFHRVKKVATRLEGECEEPGPAYPIEVVMARLGALEAGNVGLETSTDDYESEHADVMALYENAVNGWLRLDFLNRANELHNLLARGYSGSRVEEVE